MESHNEGKYFFRVHTILIILAVIFLNFNLFGQNNNSDTSKLNIYGDFRARIESDFGNHESDGDELEGRTRARVRVRLGADYSPYNNVKIGMRVRSGLIEGQQIANITIYDFDGNNTGDADFSFDKWYLEYSIGGLSTWMGRNSIPYWHQNQLHWDDDVIPVGFGVSYNTDLGKGNLELNGGLFSLPSGMQAFAGKLLLGQIVYDINLNGVGLTAAGAVLAITADRDDPDRLLFLEENGDRNYTTLQFSLQSRLKLANVPVKLGVDFAFNTEDYNDAPSGSFTELHLDEVDAYSFSAVIGDAKEPGDLQAGYTYAYIGMFAVNNSFAQDDWVRWGTAEQIRNSNFKGHELFCKVILPMRFSVVAHMFLVEGITVRSPESTQTEDGNRFRVDLNYNF